MQPPKHEGDDEQQQQDDGHQAADEDGGRAPLGLGHRLLAPGLQLWWRQGVRTAGGIPPKLEGVQGGAAAQDPPREGRRSQGCSPKLLKLVGGGPGGHQGAGGKVPPIAKEESFTTSGEKEEKKGSQTGGETQGGILQETQGTQSPSEEWEQG